MLGAAADHAGAVDQNVQSRKLPHAGLYAFVVANVERDRVADKPCSLPRRIGLGRCCARDSDLRTQRRERAPDRCANTAGTTADHCHLADKKIGAKTACAHCTDRFRNAATSAWVGSGSTAP